MQLEQDEQSVGEIASQSSMPVHELPVHVQPHLVQLVGESELHRGGLQEIPTHEDPVQKQPEQASHTNGFPIVEQPRSRPALHDSMVQEQPVCDVQVLSASKLEHVLTVPKQPQSLLSQHSPPGWQ
jgi:hypothetical protein